MKQLIVLAIAVAALKYLLDSEKGRRLKKQTIEWLDEAQEAMQNASAGTSSGMMTHLPSMD